MNKTLVKFKHVEDMSDNECIQSSYPFNPIEILQLVKLSDYIKLGDDYYTYSFCEFEPSASKEALDILYIYVEGYDDDGLN